jgi:hypothetical protein
MPGKFAILTSFFPKREKAGGVRWTSWRPVVDVISPLASLRKGGRTGGESGIRTHVRVSPKHAFQACAFSHSAISPANNLLPSYLLQIMTRKLLRARLNRNNRDAAINSAFDSMAHTPYAARPSSPVVDAQAPMQPRASAAGAAVSHTWFGSHLFSFSLSRSDK